MNFSEIFWIFIILALLQPWLWRKFLEGGRYSLLRKIEKKRKSRVVLLVHRQETLSLLGLPLIRFIDINDAEEVIRAIHLTDSEMPIDLIVHTPGGLVVASLQIARALQAHKAKVSVFVPYHAMSGGTLIALAGDEIVMSTHAVLGPIDPQIEKYPAASLIKVFREKDINKVSDKALILTDVSEKALHQLRQEVRELLENKMPSEKAEEIAELLSQGTWTHDHPISFQTIKQLGLPVNSEMPREIFELMAKFPQSTQRQQAVQYIPDPYDSPRSPENKDE